MQEAAMPWEERSPMDLRRQLVQDFAREVLTVTELADAYRVSRKTAYKWIARYAAGGGAALIDRSRRPVHCPHATDPHVIAALVQARQRHPTWGAPKLIAWLQRRAPDTRWPASSTACALLQQAGWVRTRRVRRPAVARAPVLRPPPAPNDLGTWGYKGR